MVEVVDEVHEVLHPDGTRATFATVAEAEADQAALGGQRRTRSETRRVPGAFLVVDASGKTLGAFGDASAAASAAAGHRGARVVVGPK